MYNVVLAIHVVVVLLLIGVILVQRGRSGGLVEALGGVESIFGTKTSAFLVKLTVILAVLFFSTSLSLVYLSKLKSASIYEDAAYEQEAAATAQEATTTAVDLPAALPLEEKPQDAQPPIEPVAAIPQEVNEGASAE